MDIKSREQRSLNMAAIRNKNTKPEILVRKILTKAGFRYRLHSRIYPGKPDLFLLKHKVAVFVHGCFWHRHIDCKYSYFPKSNEEFWKRKFETNVERDRCKIKQLTEMGIRAIVIWECTIRKIKTEEDTDAFVCAFKDALFNGQIYTEI